MRRQLFIDANKRVVIVFTYKTMINNGFGIITISQENQLNSMKLENKDLK